MAKFLEQVADYILAHAGDHHAPAAVIFPNKRSQVFLKDHLYKKTGTTFSLPDFYTVDEFIVSTSGLVKMEPVNIYFELFGIHKEIAGEEARTLDDFLAWAPVMLNDFNDIDLHLADAKAVFAYLSEVRALQLWNPSGKPLTELQKNYLAFYNSLYTYYRKLNENLTAGGYGYKGMIYRALFDNIESISAGWQWQQFILVGLNAMTTSEKKIFGYVNSHFKTEVLFDADNYYYSANQFGKQEAGRFIRELEHEWKIDSIKWKTNLLETDEKEIKILGIPKRIGQVKYASQLVEEWASENDKTIGEAANANDKLKDTAIVLADEKLLVPFLHSLPQVKNSRGESIPFNITMGYPLKYSPIVELITQWLWLLQACDFSNKGLYPVKNILEIFNNAFFRLCVGHFSKGKSQGVVLALLKKNMAYASKQQLLDLYGEGEEATSALLELLLTKPTQPAAFIELLTGFLIKCKPAIADAPGENPILREQFIRITIQLKKIHLLLEQTKAPLSYRAIEKILAQMINRSEISLQGEPLSGIQVMGMLETRTLDFTNLIILSANDGILPKTESIESFIPFDIRHNFKLPLPKDKTDIFAYHFFRLLQRAKTVNLIYNAEPDALGGGEKSRFILQLQEELAKANPGIKISDALIKIPLGKKYTSLSITIHKTDEILKRVQQRFDEGLSPTALTSFIHCPLQFYFRYILGLKAPELLETTIEAHVMGRVIHGVFEDLYKPLTGKIIQTKALRLTDNGIRTQVIDKFNEEYRGGNLAMGQNLLVVEVAIRYVRNFLKTELTDLEKNTRTLLSTEEKLETLIMLKDQPVKLKGIVDRTDRMDQSIRIVDYKTGKVESKNLNLKDWESLITDPEKSKAFQLLFYSFLYHRNNKGHNNLEAGIFSMRSISSGFIMLSLPDDAGITESLSQFENLLTSLAAQIADADQPFNQTDDEDRCRFCDFKNICNRAPGSDF